MLVRIDDALLAAGRSRNGAWSRQQLALLGLRWPLKPGWQRRLVGRQIDEAQARQFVALRDTHLSEGPSPTERAARTERHLAELHKQIRQHERALGRLRAEVAVAEADLVRQQDAVNGEALICWDRQHI
jgi:hypothetical protein